MIRDLFCNGSYFIQSFLKEAQFYTKKIKINQKIKNKKDEEISMPESNYENELPGQSGNRSGFMQSAGIITAKYGD